MTTTLITGANKGLGYETARQLVAAGHTVYIGARDPERGRAAAARLGARFVQLDVTDDASVAAAAKTVEADGGLDVLVNNAGIEGRTPDNGVIGPAGETAGHIHALFDTNVFGMVRMLHAFLPLLARSAAPVVVNLSSGVPRHQDQRRRPRLHRHRPQRRHRHPDRRAGRRDHRPAGPGRPGRPHRRVLRRQRPGGLVIQTLVTSNLPRFRRRSVMPANTRPAVGWIGLGDQGLPMAVGIAGADYPLHIRARHPDSLDALGDTPRVRGGEIRNLAAACDIVSLCVSTDIAACASRPGPFGSHRPTGASSDRESPRQGDCRSPSPGPGSQPEPGRQEEEDHHRQADHPGRAQCRARGRLIRGLPVTGAQGESQPQLYRVRVRGQLGQTIRSAFPALRARAEGGDTVLTGALADQAALYGVLAEVEALGLELIEVRRLQPDEPREPSS